MDDIITLETFLIKVKEETNKFAARCYEVNGDGGELRDNGLRSAYRLAEKDWLHYFLEELEQNWSRE
jgi:hypothetical protein